MLAQGEVAQDERRVARARALDVAELAPDLAELEEALRPLEGVLGLGQLPALERVGQRVIRGRRERRQLSLLGLRLRGSGQDQGSHEHAEGARQPHQWIRRRKLITQL